MVDQFPRGHCFSDFTSKTFIDYPHIGDCLGDSVGSPITWAIKNMMICSNEVSKTSIDSSSERTKLNAMIEKMIKALNLEVEMSKSSDATGLHSRFVIPNDS